ncbi:MAG TPA: hypothetical protein VGZ73_06355 [Bryobacteraceae bacterium]|nr:hypothetical protein [Bryobacteraceae bacterium]
MTGYPRRRFTGLLLALLGSFWRTGSQAVADQAPSLQNPDSDGKSAAPRTEIRRYRADAAILLLGITIFRRSGVGGGEASVQETLDGTSTTRTLFFAAGSDPARAHGLNRVGWIREVVRESNSTPTELQYFGVMTASPEESLEHARKSIATPAASRSMYSAVSGRNTPGDSRSAITHFELAAGAQWSDRRLIEAAQSTFQDKVEWRKTSWPSAPDQIPPTFLFELARLLRQRIPHAAGRYVYNEQEYLLELDRPQPGKAAGKADRLVPVHGKIRNRRTGGLTTFSVWMEDSPGSIVPRRIEYQPRSFLRLVFEAV